MKHLVLFECHIQYSGSGDSHYNEGIDALLEVPDDFDLETEKKRWYGKNKHRFPLTPDKLDYRPPAKLVLSEKEKERMGREFGAYLKETYSSCPVLRYTHYTDHHGEAN